jgi:peptide/nickel transport system permease protein/oligopeptide transport system permease protein
MMIDKSLLEEVLRIDSTSGRERALGEFLMERLEAPSKQAFEVGDGTLNVFLTMVCVGWASVARVVRSETLKLRESEYVEAARIIGVRKARIMARHILPNCLPTIIVLFTLDIPSSILTESSLSFLGMGVQPPSASWGLMVSAGRSFLFHAPWLAFAPCVAIMIIVLAFNYLGDGLRDVLDPHLQSR